jgi:phospholipid/cholesterol/gamma-HCH transport system substrate-binding protein
MSRDLKVGALIIVSLIVASAAIFLVGERSNIFARKNDYFVHFETVGGLATGNPVQLNGVIVGSVQKVVLPEDVEEQYLTVWISIDRRFADRVREDSRARIKTLGLLGDKYVDLTSGSPGFAQIESGGEIRTGAATDVEKIIATGGDAVENLVAISYSLRTILERMEAGEGILGELTTESETGTRAKKSLVETFETFRDITAKLESGQGTLGKLINDSTLVDNAESAVGHLDGILSQVESGDGAVAALLNDPATRDKVEKSLDAMSTLTQDLAALVADIKEGEGLLATMLFDKEYGAEVREDIQKMIMNLRVLSDRLEQGDGTLGQLINDPQVYEAMNDIIVGVDESKMLRWLVRNRQKSGIKVRYEDQVEGEEGPESPSQDQE